MSSRNNSSPARWPAKIAVRTACLLGNGAAVGARVVRQQDHQADTDRDGVDRADGEPLEPRPQSVGGVGKGCLREDRPTQLLADQADHGEHGYLKVPPVAQAPGEPVGDHQLAHGVPRSAVQRYQAGGQERQAAKGVNEVALRDVGVNAHPLAAKAPARQYHPENGQPPPAPGHRPTSPSTAASVRAERSALEMNPCAPLRSIWRP